MLAKIHSCARIWPAIRDSELRAEVLGPTAFPCKLASFVISSLIAVFAGMVCLLLIGTATPDSVASTMVAISVLVMVVLGGIGTRWGAVATRSSMSTCSSTCSLAGEPSFSGPPPVLRMPLSQPSFLLGVLFLLFVLFAPGGIAGLVSRVCARRPSR
jgi:branched-chain amino acid transport system permease protein